MVHLQALPPSLRAMSGRPRNAHSDCSAGRRCCENCAKQLDAINDALVDFSIISRMPRTAPEPPPAVRLALDCRWRLFRRTRHTQSLIACSVLYIYAAQMRPQLQGDLFAHGPPDVDAPPAPQRHWLDDGCWIDHATTWLHGADSLMRALEVALPWRTQQRKMYEHIVDVPRLMSELDDEVVAAMPLLAKVGACLSAHYGIDLRRGFAAYYRSGNDSVAWHNDRVDLRQPEHIAAIVSLGGPRRLMFRPKSGGPSHSFTLASGDLLVQGGAIQHRWQHCVPKVRFAHPRISLMFFGRGLAQLPGLVSSRRASVDDAQRARPSSISSSNIGPQHHSFDPRDGPHDRPPSSRSRLESRAGHSNRPARAAGDFLVRDGFERGHIPTQALNVGVELA